MTDILDIIADFIRARRREDDALFEPLYREAGVDTPIDPSEGEYVSVETVIDALTDWLVTVTKTPTVQSPLPAMVTIAQQWQNHPDFDSSWLEYSLIP